MSKAPTVSVLSPPSNPNLWPVTQKTRAKPRNKRWPTGRKPAAQTANYGIPIWKRILNGTTVTLGCNNVFGHDPRDANTGTNYADFAYDSTGRFVYVGLTNKF